MSVKDSLAPKARLRLETYVDHLDRWRGVTNLISASAFQEIWSRHIADGVFLHGLFAGATKWLDFGSGAGLPAIVLGALLAETPGAQVHCVESDGRKCAFLRSVAREIDIPVKVHNIRAELVTRSLTGPIDVLTAKAFASVDRLLELGGRYLEDGSVMILPRGKTSRAEIEEVDPMRYETRVHDDPAGNGGFFLEIRRGARGL